MVRKKKETHFITNLLTAIKKGSDTEKLKSEERKKNKKPKGYTARKLGVITLWVMILTAFTLSIIGISTKGSVDAVETTKTNEAQQLYEAVEYGKDFLTKYFSWSENDGDNSMVMQEVYSKRISPYVSDHISDTIAKNAEQITWNVSLSQENIILRKANDLSNNEYQLIYEIKPLFRKRQIANGTAENEVATPTTETVFDTKYIVLNAKYFDEVKKFLIVDLPYFTFLDDKEEKHTYNSTSKVLPALNDPYELEVIQAFLNTFFDAYANDNKDKLIYLFDNSDAIQFLNKSMKFISLENVLVFETHLEDEKVVNVDVIVAEPITNIKFTTNYSLVIGRTANGYVVKNIDDALYIQSLEEEYKTKNENKTEEGN